MNNSFPRIIIFVLFAFVILGCATTKVAEENEGLKVKPLYVGVTPNYPPVIFKQAGKIAGIEADFARLLAKELNRPVQLVELEWDRQIPALLAGKTDIIMSGMSITMKRKVRIDFADYYFKGGLLAMMRAEDAYEFDSLESILKRYSNFGVVAGTTGDVFIKDNLPYVNVIELFEPGDAPSALKRRVIDIFIHDAPSIIWMVSENEADLKIFRKQLNEEYLAWGVRRNDKEFVGTVNTIIRKWKANGSLNQILLKWLPYLVTEK